MNTENYYTETDLGNVAPNPRGEFSEAEEYEYLDYVYYQGGSYLCLAELGTTIVGFAPEAGKTTQYWQAVALPGGLTPEYVAMHDRVVNLSEQVSADTEEVRESKENIEGMETNVENLQSQAAQSAQEAEESKTQAAGYASAAEASRNAAAESETNVNAQVTGFDERVAEKTASAETDIENARIAANKAVVAQQEESVQEVKNKTSQYITEKQSEAEQAIANKQSKAVEAVNTAGATQTDAVNTAGAVQKKAVEDAGQEALNNIGTGVDSTLSTEGKAADAAATGKAVNELKGDLSNITDGGFFGVEFDYIEGGYIDGTTGEVVSYETWKYTDFIDISERENNTIYLMTDGNKSVYNVFYDANKQLLFSRADNIGVLDETSIFSNAKYVRLSCRITAKQTLKIYKTKRATMTDIEKVKNAIQISTYLKVATYNVGIFNNGISGVETENAIDKMNEFRKIIGSINADILNAQEFKEYFDLGNTYSSLDVVNFKYPHNTKSINQNNSLSFLKYPITNAVKKAFDSGSGKYYVAFDITVGGKTITVINAHLAIEEDVSVHRSSEIAELITFMDTKDYVILTGDMNASSQSEYDAYKTAGYKICNGGDFGWFNTWPIRKNMPSSWNTTWPCENLDNIIVSDNITPQYVETIDCVISDHAPLVATLRID